MAQFEKRNPLVAGAHLTNNEEPARGHSNVDTHTIRIGIVRRVHADSATMDVHLVGNSDLVVAEVQVHFPYAGPAGFIGTLPEIGCLVVLADTSHGLVPISYQIPQKENALNYNMMEDFPVEVSDPLQEPFRVKPSVYRYLRPGETRIASSTNSELFLNEDVELHDSKGAGLRIRSGDATVMSTSHQNYMFSLGVWRSAGPIQRNSLKSTLNGVEQPDYVATNVVHSDGTKSVYIGGDYKYGGAVYNEYRLEVEDTCPIATPVNDINMGVNAIHRTPKVIHVMGNYVGNDSLVGGTYGKFLAPNFITPTIGDGQLNFETLNTSGTDQDLIGSRGVAWAYHVPDKSFVGVDKEGVYHAYYGASRAGSIVGASQLIVGRGGRKEEWGSILEGNLSWDMFCKGGINWVIGKSTESPGRNLVPRSLTARYLGATYTEHGYTSAFDPQVLNDVDGNPLPYANKLTYRKVDRTFGNSREEVTNNSEEIIGGSKVLSIGSELAIDVSGASSESVIGDKTINSTGNFTVNAANIQLVSQNRKEKFAAGSVEKLLLLGDDTTDIVTGGHRVTMLAGNRILAVGTGNSTKTIGTGNDVTTIGLGNYSVTVGTGSISMTTGVGAVVIGGNAVSVNATAAFDVVAATVGLGITVTRSGVITALSHLDYVTGAPLMPSKTVLAAL